MTRAALATTRNPLLTLPAAQRLSSLSPECRAEMRALLLDLSADSRARAEHSWRKHKAPMAAYWKAVAVYSRHAASLLRTR